MGRDPITDLMLGTVDPNEMGVAGSYAGASAQLSLFSERLRSQVLAPPRLVMHPRTAAVIVRFGECFSVY